MHSIISRQAVPSFVTVIKRKNSMKNSQYKAADFSHYRKNARSYRRHKWELHGSDAIVLPCGLTRVVTWYLFLGDYAGSGVESAENIENSKIC